MAELDPNDFELLLADFPRSYRTIADAILDATQDDGELSPIARAGRITRGLVDRYLLIDRKAVTYLIMALTGYLAEVTGKTPREIHEELFQDAPSDAWWKDRLSARDRRTEDT